MYMLHVLYKLAIIQFYNGIFLQNSIITCTTLKILKLCYQSDIHVWRFYNDIFTKLHYYNTQFARFCYQSDFNVQIFFGYVNKPPTLQLERYFVNHLCSIKVAHFPDTCIQYRSRVTSPFPASSSRATRTRARALAPAHAGVYRSSRVSVCWLSRVAKQQLPYVYAHASNYYCRKTPCQLASYSTCCVQDA